MNVAHHKPILYKHTPEWQKRSWVSHCRRSNQRAETRRVLPEDEEEQRGSQKLLLKQHILPVQLYRRRIFYLHVQLTYKLSTYHRTKGMNTDHYFKKETKNNLCDHEEPDEEGHDGDEQQKQ